MTEVNLDSLQGLDWLVEARNQIQSLMLDLHKLYDRGPIGVTLEQKKKWERRWQWADGAAFSLWRAVFLIDTKEESRLAGHVMQKGAAFLEQVIKTNSVTFADDRNHHEWSSGYYVNNAAFRIARLYGRSIDSVDRPFVPLHQRWNQFFRELRDAVTSELQMPRTEKARLDKGGA